MVHIKHKGKQYEMNNKNDAEKVTKNYCKFDLPILFIACVSNGFRLEDKPLKWLECFFFSNYSFKNNSKFLNCLATFTNLVSRLIYVQSQKQ